MGVRKRGGGWGVWREKGGNRERGAGETLAACGLEEPRNFQELLNKSVGPVHFS